ncbi:hypothetical protein [Clostridium sp. CF012]|nr:hypothetical protein [Clostridium sp. CF012]
MEELLKKKKILEDKLEERKIHTNMLITLVFKINIKKNMMK